MHLGKIKLQHQKSENGTDVNTQGGNSGTLDSVAGT
jgi:hypothetical protein